MRARDGDAAARIDRVDADVVEDGLERVEGAWSWADDGRGVAGPGADGEVDVPEDVGEDRHVLEERDAAGLFPHAVRGGAR